jgi:hypothetical protein
MVSFDEKADEGTQSCYLAHYTGYVFTVPAMTLFFSSISLMVALP